MYTGDIWNNIYHWIFSRNNIVWLGNALRRQTGGATTLIVAQRVGTIMNVDQILVLDNGRIVGHGTHDELMTRGGFYMDLYNSQFDK